jgi:hypothetical protein
MTREAIDRALNLSFQLRDVLSSIKVCQTRNLGGRSKDALELAGMLACDILDAIEELREGEVAP